MIFSVYRTFLTKKLWSLTVIFVGLIFIFMLINQRTPNASRNVDSYKQEMSLNVLIDLVKADAANQRSIKAGDFDINKFLEQVKKDDLKWGFKQLTDQQIEELGREISKDLPSKDQNSSQIKYVLYWNEAYGGNEYGFCCGQDPFIKAKCPRTDCYATNNRSLMPHQDFDAILFHQRSLVKTDLPLNRSQHQRYIMWMMESAAYPFGFESSAWNNFFNWTMTFRKDSDFPFLYGHIDKLKDHQADVNALIEKFGRENSGLKGEKNKAVAWFASNCQSESLREDYVTELKKHIQVDIFGACGNLKCDRSNETACWELVDREYYFYLSFENSICTDYVTEKFFNAMTRKVVPIVIGGTDYNTSAGAPIHSHINAFTDYKNPADLARYLQSLMDDAEKYAEYFWWKQFYASNRNDDSLRHPAWCEMCRQMHENTKTKIYTDLEEWWVHKSKCKKVRVPKP